MNSSFACLDVARSSGASVRSGTDLFGGEFASCDLRGVSFEGERCSREIAEIR